MTLVFHSVAEMESAFRAYVEQVSSESVAALVEASANMIEQRYRNLPYPIKVNGEDVSRVPPVELAAAVSGSVIGLRGLIQIDPSKADEEWSARRYAALLVNGNPFSSALAEIDTPQKIAEITGLKMYP